LATATALLLKATATGGSKANIMAGAAMLAVLQATAFAASKPH